MPPNCNKAHIVRTVYTPYTYCELSVRFFYIFMPLHACICIIYVLTIMNLLWNQPAAALAMFESNIGEYIEFDESVKNGIEMYRTVLVHVIRIL